MPSHPDAPRFKGITLPPSGWVLAVLLVAYIFTGLIGHDPWKYDDAVTIGVVHDIVSHGHWLRLQLAGYSHPDAPLYYWTAALTAHLFSWLLPLHDAARLASGIYTLLALEFILLAARELHGRANAAAAPLILAGSIGFLFHAHEAQPMLAALAAHAAAYWSLTLLPRRPRYATAVFGVALALAFLANGLLPVLTLIPLCLYTLWQAPARWPTARLLLAGLGIALALCAAWLLPLYLVAPDYLAQLWRNELHPLGRPVAVANNVLRHLNLLLWYAWPALPLAAWALWAKRRALASKPLALPITTFGAVLLFLGADIEVSSAAALLLLPPLVLLAVPGVTSLRRGAANAFDWFGVMVFIFFGILVWLGWSALHFGWPPGLARQVTRMAPDFQHDTWLLGAIVGTALSLLLLFLPLGTQRNVQRGATNWALGMTLLWCLAVMLWQPWFAHTKNYQPLATELRQALGPQPGCIKRRNLGDTQRAALDYFAGIRTLSFDAKEECRLLLTYSTSGASQSVPEEWNLTWERRLGGGRKAETFRLYRRG